MFEDHGASFARELAVRFDSLRSLIASLATDRIRGSSDQAVPDARRILGVTEFA